MTRPNFLGRSDVTSDIAPPERVTLRQMQRDLFEAWDNDNLDQVEALIPEILDWDVGEYFPGDWVVFDAGRKGREPDDLLAGRVVYTFIESRQGLDYLYIHSDDISVGVPQHACTLHVGPKPKPKVYLTPKQLKKRKEVEARKAEREKKRAAKKRARRIKQTKRKLRLKRGVGTKTGGAHHRELLNGGSQLEAKGTRSIHAGTYDVLFGGEGVSRKDCKTWINGDDHELEDGHKLFVTSYDGGLAHYVISVPPSGQKGND